MTKYGRLWYLAAVPLMHDGITTISFMLYVIIALFTIIINTLYTIVNTSDVNDANI